MSNDLSDLSQKEFDHISDTDMESADVVEYFYNGLKVRKFADVLQKFAAGKTMEEIKELLEDKLYEFSPESERDSVRRKIRNWFSDDPMEPDDKKTLVQICFALGLNEDKTRRFMKFTQESGFHMRDPQDAAFLYCLRKGKNYREAEIFAGKFPMPSMNADKNGKTIHTEIIAKAFENVSGDEEFKQFYNENLENFGRLHNTAHNRLQDMIEQLKKDGYSLEEIVNDRLRGEVRLDKKTSGYDAIQKSVRAFWPNLTEMKNMLNRKKSVTRKVLLLLYVKMDGVVQFSDNENDRPCEKWMEHVTRVNLMLDRCGLAYLDPRNPFDWLVLYSLKADGEEGAEMLDQLKDVVKRLLPEAGNRFDYN